MKTLNNKKPKNMLIVANDPVMSDLILECIQMNFQFNTKTARSEKKALSILLSNSEIDVITIVFGNQKQTIDGINMITTTRSLGNKTPFIVIALDTNLVSDALSHLDPIDFISVLQITDALPVKINHALQGLRSDPTYSHPPGDDMGTREACAMQNSSISALATQGLLRLLQDPVKDQIYSDVSELHPKYMEGHHYDTKILNAALNFFAEAIGTAKITISKDTPLTGPTVVSHGNLAYLLAHIASHRDIEECLIQIICDEAIFSIKCEFYFVNTSNGFVLQHLEKASKIANSFGYSQSVADWRSIEYTLNRNKIEDKIVKYGT